jgi:mannitol operon transcriptional antiterminator
MTIELTARQKYILQTIYDAEVMDAESMLERLRVSRRTIQRDLHTLQDYLNAFGVALDLSSLKSIALVGDPSDVARAVVGMERLPKVLALNPKEREFHIVSELLRTDGPVKIAYLSHRIHVADASISSDLDKLTNWFTARGLGLVRRRGYGVEVLGSERAKREALAELLHNHISVYQLMNAWSRHNAAPSDNDQVSLIDHWFDRHRVEQVKDILEDELKDVAPPLDEAAFYGFMVHVLLSVERLKESHPVTYPDVRREMLRGTSEFEVAERVLKRLLPEGMEAIEEASYLASHLRGAKVQLTGETRILPLKITTMQLAHRIVLLLSEQMDVPLSTDQQLLSGLSQHLEPAVYRMSAGMTIRNPLLTEVIRRYAELFRRVEGVTRLVFQDYGYQVPDEEVGYLTMHVGAAIERWRAGNRPRVKIVCPNGISSAELLAQRVRMEFPQVDIVGVGSVHAVDREDADFVISTVSVVKYNRMIHVSPFLTDEDIKKIKDQLSNWQPGRKEKTPTGQILPWHPERQMAALAITENVAVRQVVVEAMADLITLVAADVQAQGVSPHEDEVEAALHARERLGSVVLPGQALALLHARCTAMTRCYVAVYRLSQAIRMKSIGFHEEEVQTVLVILARVDERPEVIALLGALSSALISEEGLSETLKQADESHVRETILHTFNQTQER